MRARVALVTALVGLMAATATATAVPPTPAAMTTGPLVAFTLPVGSPPPATTSPAAMFRASEVTPSARPPAIVGEPGTAPLPSLEARRQPAPKAGVVVKPTPRPKPRATSSRATSTGRSLRGPASWYCNRDSSRAQLSVCHHSYPDTGGFNAYAAAGPKLRAALGGGNRWRGRIVTVDGVRVKLVDWCQCYKGQSSEKLIDVYYDVFRKTGGSVTVRW